MGTKLNHYNHFMGVNIVILMGIAFFMLFFSITAFAEENIDLKESSPLFFSVQIDNNNEKMARKALEDILSPVEIELGRHIPLGLARIDLNNDGIKELFVRLLEPDVFCDDYDCQIYGFAITENGFVKIADIKTKGIDVLSHKTDGTKDLMILKNNGTREKLVWQESFYRPLEKSEGNE